MTFRGFLVNYLSPWYFLLRLFWIMDAFIGWFFTMAILSGKGWSPQSAHYAGLAVALFFVWIALRPWKIGASYNDISNGIDSVKRKLDKR